MRHSDKSILINAGPEQAVASTKATTAQLSIMALLAYATPGSSMRALAIGRAFGQVNEMLNPRYDEHIQKLAAQLKELNDIYIIGRGVNFRWPWNARSLAEVSYIHGRGLPAASSNTAHLP